MLSIDTIKQAVSSAALEYPLKRVELFGSYANGTATEHSDVDVLVEFSRPNTSLLEFLGFQQFLIEELNMDVDLVEIPLRPLSKLIIDRTVRLYGA